MLALHYFKLKLNKKTDLLINTVIILSPNNYLITNYVGEKQEQHMHPSSNRKLRSNFLIVLLKLLKVFADLIFLDSFPLNFSPR